MSLRQLLKCFSCTSKNESTTHESFFYSTVSEMSETVFDPEGNQQSSDETKKHLPGLTKIDANDAVAEIWNKYVDSKRLTYEKELNLRTFIDKSSGKVFRWLETINDGDPPDTGRSLWILMYGCDTSKHGGEEEDFKITENGSICILPICSTDWQQEYIDIMLDRLIEYHIIVNAIQPNRVFLLGISSIGSDGVYQLAARMTDRWPAVGVMSGNPSDVSPISLRNLPFGMYISGEDNNRFLARTWAQSLEQCARQNYRGGFHYWLKIGDVQEQKQDLINWMNKFTRNPWPRRIFWYNQGFTLHKRFYWIVLPFSEQMKKGQTMIVEVKNRKNIYFEQFPEDVKAIVIRLSDSLVNLDQEITVYDDRETAMRKIFHGFVPRTRTAIEQSIEERADPMSAATAWLHVIWDSKNSLMSCHSSVDADLTCPICYPKTIQT